MDLDNYDLRAAAAGQQDGEPAEPSPFTSPPPPPKGHKQSYSEDFNSPRGTNYSGSTLLAEGVLQSAPELDFNGNGGSEAPPSGFPTLERPHSSNDAMASNQENARPSTNSSQKSAPDTKNQVVIKVGMVGDAQIGKTSLMVKYVEGEWDEDYIQTLGVNFMEKTISIRNNEITFSIWDLGGQREFVNMLPLVCNDAVAILFMFDLTRKSTLNSIKEWYRQGRGFNKTAIPFLIGTKYDQYINMPEPDQQEIQAQAMKFAKAMHASLIYCSTSHSINVQKIFKIVLSKAFGLVCTLQEMTAVGEPLLIYKSVD